MFEKKFFDKYWNFDNREIEKLLSTARKKRLKALSQKRWGPKNIEIALFNSASKKDVWQMINKLSIFVSSGIDIKGALSILIKQIKNPYLQKIVTEIKENIDHGIAINETMSAYPKVFDELTVALVAVWEKTWQLWPILNELDTNMLESIELKGKVKGAMIYPMVLLGLTLCMVVFMMSFIVPKITASFAKTGTELPWLTQMIVNVSDFLKNDWLTLLGVLALIFIGAKIINMTQGGRMFFARAQTKLPVFWYIAKQSNIIFFIKSFTILIDSWVLLLESLKTSARVVPNLAYKKELIRIKNEVEVGLTMSKSLWLNLDYEETVYLNQLFSEEFAYVVATGEETWTLSKSLKKIWENYNKELKRYIENLSSMMEPMIIVIVGILVGTIVVGIMLPFFSLGKAAKNL